MTRYMLFFSETVAVYFAFRRWHEIIKHEQVAPPADEPGIGRAAL